MAETKAINGGSYIIRMISPHLNTYAILRISETKKAEPNDPAFLEKTEGDLPHPSPEGAPDEISWVGDGPTRFIKAYNMPKSKSPKLPRFNIWCNGQDDIFCCSSTA